METDSGLQFEFKSFWIEAPNQRKRVVNVLCPVPEALAYAIHPAPDEHVSPRTALFLEKLKCRLLASERPGRNELVDFFEGLRRCLKIGLSVLEAIDMVVDSARTPTFRGIIATLHLKMRRRHAVSSDGGISQDL